MINKIIESRRKEHGPIFHKNKNGSIVKSHKVKTLLQEQRVGENSLISHKKIIYKEIQGVEINMNIFIKLEFKSCKCKIYNIVLGPLLILHLLKLLLSTCPFYLNSL